MTDEYERRETFFRDRDGDFKSWVELIGFMLLFGGIIMIVVGATVGISAIQDKYEVEVFNRVHGTDYTWGEWFWAEGAIKEYIIGPVENQNYQIDLNINGLKGGGE